MSVRSDCCDSPTACFHPSSGLGLKCPNRIVACKYSSESWNVGFAMVGQPLVSHPGGYNHDILHLSDYRQPEDAPECIYYSLWMVMQYVANEYPDRGIRDKTRPLKLDTIADHIDIGDIGWENMGQEPLTQLSDLVGSIELNLEYRYNGLPQSVDEFAKEGLEKLLPTIILIDKVMLESGERGTGPMHAVVVCGIGESHITIEDPLVEGTTTFEIDNLDDAWDDEFNASIQVDLRKGLDPVQREEL